MFSVSLRKSCSGKRGKHKNTVENCFQNLVPRVAALRWHDVAAVRYLNLPRDNNLFYLATHPRRKKQNKITILIEDITRQLIFS